MTRKEQIDTAACRRANQFTHPVEWNEAYCKFREGAKWADSHHDWHKADEELPPIDKAIAYKFSKKVLVSDGERIHISRYDYEMDGRLVIDMGGYPLDVFTRTTKRKLKWRHLNLVQAMKLRDAYQNQENYARIAIIGVRKRWSVLMTYLNAAKVIIQAQDIIFWAVVILVSDIVICKNWGELI